MYFKIETPDSTATNTKPLSLEELKNQHTRFILDCGF